MKIDALYIQEHLDRAEQLNENALATWSKELAIHVMTEAKRILGEGQASEVSVPLTFTVKPEIERACIKICISENICTGHIYP